MISDKPFAAVARFSEIGSELYDLSLRPFIRAMASPASAEMLAHISPMRLQRWFESDRNPLMRPIKTLADQIRAHRMPATADNPFRKLERFGASLVSQWWDGVRDMQNALIEWNFHLLWGTPAVQALGERLSHTVSAAPQEDLRALTSVQEALERIDQGGFADGVVRMLIFLAHSRKAVRRSRLKRSNQMLLSTEPFASMPPRYRTDMIHKESLIVGYEPERALATLPLLIAGQQDRQRALALCREIAGPPEEMSPETIEMMDRLALALGQPIAGAPLQALTDDSDVTAGH